MSRTNYDEFVVNKKLPKLNTYITWGLKEVEKDGTDVVGLVSVSPEGYKSFYLKRCVGNHFFNPFDSQKGTKSDINYKDHKGGATWEKVTFTCYSKYVEFLQGGSRVALAKAEREYLSE